MRRKRVSARLPVAVVIEPAVVERCPMNSQFFQLGNGVHHLLRRDVRFISPSAPAHGVVFFVEFRARQTFAFDGSGPSMQWLVVISAIDDYKGSRCRKTLARL